MITLRHGCALAGYHKLSGVNTSGCDFDVCIGLVRTYSGWLANSKSRCAQQVQWATPG